MTDEPLRRAPRPNVGTRLLALAAGAFGNATATDLPAVGASDTKKRAGLRGMTFKSRPRRRATWTGGSSKAAAKASARRKGARRAKKRRGRGRRTR